MVRSFILHPSSFILSSCSLNLVDHPADQPRRAAGLSGRFRAGHADAVPADRDADLPLGGRVFVGQRLRRRPATIVGYSYRDMIAYYLLTMISRAFSSMPGLASGIARDIRDGTVKKYLIQPIDMLGFLLLYRVAHKLVYYTVAAAPFALVFYLCRGYFPAGPTRSTLAGLPRLAGDVVPAGLLPGSHARHDRLLVPRGQFAAVRLHAVQLLLLRPHVSHRHAAGRLGQVVKHDPAAIPGLFPRGRVPGQDHGPELGLGLWHAVRLGRVLHGRQPRRVPLRHDATAGMEDDGMMKWNDECELQR